MIEILTAGAFELIKLIPIWAGATTPEQKEAVKARAREVVGEMGGKFDALDAKDKADMDALQASIDAAKGSM